jgi:hypothetical protein
MNYHTVPPVEEVRLGIICYHKLWPYKSNGKGREIELGGGGLAWHIKTPAWELSHKKGQ